MSYSSKTLIHSNTEAATYEKRLSICIEPNGFSFSESDAQGRLLTFGEAEGAHAPQMTGVMSDVKSFLAAVHMPAIGYSAMELIVPADEHVWMPDELYVSGNNHQYLRAVGGTAAAVMTSQCREVGLTDIFGADDTLVTAFKVALPGIVVKSQHVKLAESALRQRSKDHPLVVILWRGSRLDVAAFREGRYVFGNSLPFESASDALFQTVGVLRSAGIEDRGAELLMCGEANRERFAEFSPYFPKATLFTGLLLADDPAFRQLRTYRHALVLM